MLKSTVDSSASPSAEATQEARAPRGVLREALRSPLRLPEGSAPSGAPTTHDRLVAETDSVIDEMIAEVASDPDAVGLVLHGSRASGSAGVHSNYDFAYILSEDAFARRRQRGTIVERRFRSGSPPVEVVYESIGTLRRATSGGRRRAMAYAIAKSLVDKTGEVGPLLTELVAAGQPDRDSVADQYDRYLHGFAHSLKAWSRGDDLGARAHAAQSGLSLIGALFALEGTSVPYLDQLSIRLPELDAAQGWRPGFLPSAVHRLFYAPDPPFQQMLERRVSRLMESRGILHRWRHDLDRLRAVSYDEL